MKAFFQARGYSEALLNGDLCKISTVSRNEALRPPAERDSTDSRVPLVLTYNQFNTGTKQILLDNFEMLLSDPATLILLRGNHIWTRDIFFASGNGYYDTKC